jgi:hypothetical protein
MTRSDASATSRDAGLSQMPVRERIDWVIQRARCQSADFKGAGSWLDRSSYMAHHPTAIAVFMCYGWACERTSGDEYPAGHPSAVS